MYAEYRQPLPLAKGDMRGIWKRELGEIDSILGF